MEHHGSDELRHFLLPGFCGGLTTFSAVTLQTAHAVSDGFLLAPGFGYLLETVILSLLVVAAAIPIARKIFSVME